MNVEYLMDLLKDYINGNKQLLRVGYENLLRNFK